MNGTYTILSKTGEVIPYVPNAFQRRLYQEWASRSLVILARVCGVTTACVVDAVDDAMHHPDQHIHFLVANHDMQCAIRDQILFVITNAEPTMRLSATKKDCLKFQNGSVIRFDSLSPRGESIDRLFICNYDAALEKGAPYTRDPLDAILHCIPSAGKVVITMQKPERKHHRARMTALRAYKKRGQFKLHFFPWWMNENCVVEPEYILELMASGSAFYLKLAAHFEEIEIINDIELSLGQKAFFAKKADFIGLPGAKHEYPSFIEEVLWG